MCSSVCPGDAPPGLREDGQGCCCIVTATRVDS
jgi:hypothetical protein